MVQNLQREFLKTKEDLETLQRTKRKLFDAHSTKITQDVDNHVDDVTKRQE